MDIYQRHDTIGKNRLSEMKCTQERRAHKRYPYTPAIVYIYCNSELVQSADAKMINYGKGGMSFESNTALMPGTNLYIQLNGNLPNRPHPLNQGLYQVILTEVRWCKRNEIMTDSYRIGVKYLLNRVKPQYRVRPQ